MTNAQFRVSCEVYFSLVPKERYILGMAPNDLTQSGQTHPVSQHSPRSQHLQRRMLGEGSRQCSSLPSMTLHAYSSLPRRRFKTSTTSFTRLSCCHRVATDASRRHTTVLLSRLFLNLREVSLRQSTIRVFQGDASYTDEAHTLRWVSAEYMPTRARKWVYLAAHSSIDIQEIDPQTLFMRGAATPCKACSSTITWTLVGGNSSARSKT